MHDIRLILARHLVVCEPVVGDELGVPPAEAGAALGQRGAVPEHLAHRGRLLGEEPGHDNSEENSVSVTQSCLPGQLGLGAVLGHLGVPDHLWAHQGLALVDEVYLVGGQHCVRCSQDSGVDVPCPGVTFARSARCSVPSAGATLSNRYLVASSDSDREGESQQSIVHLSLILFNRFGNWLFLRFLRHAF